MSILKILILGSVKCYIKLFTPSMGCHSSCKIACSYFMAFGGALVLIVPIGIIGAIIGCLIGD